jgi:uncharacterized protein (DUF1786 family)
MSNRLIDERGLQAAADWLVDAKAKNKVLLVDFGVGQIIGAYLKAADQIVVTEAQYQQWVMEYNDLHKQLKEMEDNKRSLFRKMDAYLLLKEQGQ